jgi:hypothetical protein
MKCSGLHCQGCGRRGGNAGAGAGAVIALIVLAAIAANRRAIGHAASTALHVAIVTTITLAIAAIPVLAAIVATRRCRARGRAAAARPAAHQSREIPLARVQALPPATPRPAHPAGCDCVPCLAWQTPGPPAALVPPRPRWPSGPGWTNQAYRQTTTGEEARR